MIDNFFIDFDVMLCVAIGKFELDETNREAIFVENIWSRDVAKKTNEKTNEQLNVAISTRFDVKFRVINIVAISVCFDVILNVAIERCEHFDDINSDIDIDVAEKIDETSETSETNEQIVDFFLILYIDSDVEDRKFEFFDVIVEMTDFWA